jgi:Xaa-Pro aminopeptidase
MFNREIYRQRRQKLVSQIDSGLILLLGNVETPFNATDNHYRFRQDSSFLYFCGHDQSGLAVLLDADSGDETLFGVEPGLEDTIWSGPSSSLAEKGEQVGIAHSDSFERLDQILVDARKVGRTVHFLPTCRAENRITLSRLTGISLDSLENSISQNLVKAVVTLRSAKGEEEVRELDGAADLGFELHTTAIKMAVPGRYEWEISGALEAVAARAGRMLSFPPIVTVHGETLHNHQRDNRLKKGDLLLVDAGVESELHYASDHTRTCPVGGLFDSRQREIYMVVLRGLERAKGLIRPGITYLDVHIDVCRTLVDGLKDLGLMEGDTDHAVAAGAHALFMPHGLGHMLGLDVHDMEDLGEDIVGYDDKVRRSEQFGTSRLRLGRELEKNFALTVEPGIYFIPALIEQWKSARRCHEFIKYSRLESYFDFGGIRLEDDVLVTANGNRLLGKALPLQIDEIEAYCHC